MKIQKIIAVTSLLLVLSQVTHFSFAGECDTSEQLLNSRKSLMVDLQIMQANLRGLEAKINQAFKNAAKQNNWTPIYQANLHKHILQSKQYADFEAEKKSYSQELTKEQMYFDGKTMRLKTADACNQRLKIKGVSSKINSVIDRQFDYVAQQIKLAIPDK